MSASFEPGYLKLHRDGQLKARGDSLWSMMESCTLCPRKCRVSRLEGEKGDCGANAQLEVSSFHAHYGEEDPLVGRGGSGTIFLSHCGLGCVFCINGEISQGGEGRERTVSELATMILALQQAGCSNINFVSPSHYAPHIVLAIDEAASKGLRLPIVYNSCGWERLEILKLLDGVVDIYLADFKFSDEKMAMMYASGAANYVTFTREALIEMNRQVGVAKPASDGLMYRGLMIRHLVMPNDVSGTKQAIEWIGENLPKDTYLNLMSQYRPSFRAYEYPEISRGITLKEYTDAINWARLAGLTNVDIKGYQL